MNRTSRHSGLAILCLPLAMLSACSETSGPDNKSVAPPIVSRPAVDPAILAQGKTLFATHCAACHGDRAQGAANWQQVGPDGKYPPPALDGSAHAWHHPTAVLRQVIRNGTQRIGGNMPPWRDRLNDAEIDAIIAWFQSLWPDEIFAAWADMNRKASQ